MHGFLLFTCLAWKLNLFATTFNDPECTFTCDVGKFTGYRYEDSSTYSTKVIRKFRIVYEHGVRPSQASRINEPDQETSRGPVAAVSNEYAPADRNCVVRDPVG